MSRSNPKYQHEPLLDDNIRLFVLSPGDASSPLCGHLAHANLFDPPSSHPYKALSYTWGDSSRSTTLSLGSGSGSGSNVCQTQITPNLSVALKHLRSPQAPVTLWIDQICIDQSNPKEKETQISLMRQIYQRSEEVLAWLGPASKSTDFAMDIVPMIDWDKFLTEASAEDRPSMVLPRIRWAISELWKRPWWSRTWILQEATAHKPTMTSIVCGKKKVSLATFLNLSSALSQRSEVVTKNIEMFLICAIMFDMIKHISGFRQLIHCHEEAPPLFKLLERTPDLRTSDPRDKIYSMVGFSKEFIETGHSFRIDYTCSPFEAYINCALWHISRYRCLDIFAYHAHHRVALDTRRPRKAGTKCLIMASRSESQLPDSEAKGRKHIPTWVPSWTQVSAMQKLSGARTRNQLPCFQASGHYRSVECDLRKKPPQSVVHLSLLGVRVSTVSIIKEKLPEMRKFPFAETTVLSNFNEMMRKWEPLDKDRLCPLTGLTMRSVFERTVSADLTIITRPGPTTYCRRLDGKFPDEPSGEAPTSTFWVEFAPLKVCPDRCLFYTAFTPDGSPGLMGLGPKHLAPGDEVWILQGSRVPVILRPRLVTQDCTFGSMDLETGVGENKFIAAGATVHELVGEGFILGLMDGEVVDMLGPTPKRRRPPPLVDMDINFRKIGLV